jgi:multidrug efflux pump subunit AcrA (membrane-fusion protein)
MAGTLSNGWSTKRGWIITAVAVLILAAIFIAWRLAWPRAASSTVSAAGTTPTATAVRGELVDSVELRGQIQAFHTSILEAPADSGQIQIVKLAKDGDFIHKGDIAAVFDPATLQTTLDQRRSDLKQVEMQLADAHAQEKLLE